MTDKTGGPAFPTESKLGLNKDKTWITQIPGYSGMTLRDYFAAKALQGVITGVETRGADYSFIECAELSYDLADAMLKAREK
jgi:hypothetical protein